MSDTKMSALSHEVVNITLTEYHREIDIQGEVYLSKKPYYTYRAHQVLSGKLVMSGSLGDNINDRTLALNFIYGRFPKFREITTLKKSSSILNNLSTLDKLPTLGK